LQILSRLKTFRDDVAPWEAIPQDLPNPSGKNRRNWTFDCGDSSPLSPGSRVGLRTAATAAQKRKLNFRTKFGVRRFIAALFSFVRRSAKLARFPQKAEINFRTPNLDCGDSSPLSPRFARSAASPVHCRFQKRK
jgi:hypothetical protein